MNSYKVVREMRHRVLSPWTFAAITLKSGKLPAIAVVPACAALLFGALSLPAFGQVAAGGLRGVTRDSASGQPVSHVRVVAHNVGKHTDLAAVSSDDGTFEIATLEAGAYEVEAIKDGFVDSSTNVVVAAHADSRVDLKLTAAHPNATQPEPAANAATVQTSDISTSLVKELQAMKERIEQLEAQLKNQNAQDSAKAETSPSPVLLATATKDAGLLPRLPAGPLNPTEKDLVAANALPPAPIPTPAPAPAPQAAAPAPAGPTLPDALSAPEPGPPGVDNFTFGAYGDFTWLNGTTRTKDTILDTKFFTPEVRFDTHYMEDFNQPQDHTIGGATESFRSGEVQIEQISVGGDFHWQNVRGRVLYMAGLFATTTPRNDASFGVGQWDLRSAYKYTSEAWGGYHFNVNHGLNVDAGIFVSYIGLFSYYNFDNWTYQPSYVSSNTPWFFNGVRIQWFPTSKLKIEPWFVNGWQSYAKYNGHPGLGGQLLWLPKEWFKLVANQYGLGQDNLGLPHTERLHTDDSIEVRYFNRPMSTGITKMAFSLTGDAGIQHGGGVCGLCGASAPKEVFLGWMAYDRVWWHKDTLALTFGGGQMSNPGRYLTLLPPINGADAVTGSPYFPATPGSKAHMWDSTVTLQYMPKQYITWWAEVGYRHSDIPYFSGRGGITPPGFPLGGTNGAPGQFACLSGAPSGASDLATATANCGSTGVWFPDLRRSEAKLSVGVMVKF